MRKNEDNEEDYDRYYEPIFPGYNNFLGFAYVAGIILDSVYDTNTLDFSLASSQIM